jgi:hypothetical protein
MSTSKQFSVHSRMPNNKGKSKDETKIGSILILLFIAVKFALKSNLDGDKLHLTVHRLD